MRTVKGLIRHNQFPPLNQYLVDNTKRKGVLRILRFRKRHVPLNPRALEVLRKIRAESVGSEFVFPGDPPDRIFPEVVQRAGMKNFRWHDLRHEFCSRLVMLGVPILTVKELAGHKRLETTLRYAHLAPRHLRAAVDLLCAPKTSAAERSA